MKTYNLLILIIFAQISWAQVAIGKETIDGSAILDFASNTNSGIILPWVTENPVQEKGSLIYNTTNKKVMFFDGEQWQDLSISQGNIDTSKMKFSTSKESEQGVIIGAEDSKKHGVLILDDDTKALVLPKSEKPWLNVKSPEPGTILYDTSQKLICIFNGKVWTFWGI